MNKRLIPILLMLLLVPSTSFTLPLNTQEELREVSITVKAASSMGSGTVFIHEFNKERIAFILTAAHVVKSSLATKKIKIPHIEIVPESGKKFHLKQVEREVKYFKKVQIIKDMYYGVKLITRVFISAKVIKYSEAYDLAILRVDDTRLLSSGIAWINSNSNPKIGTKVWHVGSVHGLKFANTVLEGIISGTDRTLKIPPWEKSIRIYDQISFSVEPGCSGGGVFLEDKRLIGMITRKYLHTGFMVPIRDILTWLAMEDISWILNPKLKKPTLKKLKKLRLFDKIRLY